MRLPQLPLKGQLARALALIRANGYFSQIIMSYSGRFLLIIVAPHPEGESNAAVQTKVMTEQAPSVRMGRLKL